MTATTWTARPSATLPHPEQHDRPTLGILGGMGPLASARLLETLYRRNAADREQETPKVLLLSDPTVPDRTAALLDGDEEALARHLEERLQLLADAGAAPLIVACFTAHGVFDRLPARLAEITLSLIDLTLEAQAADRRPRLLLATHGTYRTEIFQRHPLWRAVEPTVALLGSEDRRHLHDGIYRLKRGAPADELRAWVADAVRRYGADGPIYACTELHLLHRSDPYAPQEDGVLDALLLAADRATAWSAPAAA